MAIFIISEFPSTSIIASYFMLADTEFGGPAKKNKTPKITYKPPGRKKEKC